MTGAVFAETLRRNWKAIIWWGGSLALLAMSVVLILPDVDAIKEIAKLMESFPPALLAMFGGDDLEFMATPEGYMSLQFFSWIPLILAIYAVLAGLNVTANEEDQGILDMVLSLPIPRWRIIVEKFLAYSLLIIAMLILTFIGLWISVLMVPTLEISITKLAEGTVNILPPVLLVLAFTIAAGTITRRRSHAAGLATIFVVASYTLDMLGRAASGTILDSLRAISFYSFYDSASVMRNGLAWAGMILIVAVALILLAGSVWAFERRDVGV